MRNLKINRIQRTPINTENGEISGIVAITLNTSTVLFYIKDGQFYMFRDDKEILLTPQSFENLIGKPEYLEFERRVWFATKDMLVYYDYETEEVVSVPLQTPAQCFAWNPTKELLAVVHENGQVVTYTVDFNRMDCTSLDSAVPDSVYVGWGSADTQFRGSEGKLKKQLQVEQQQKSIEDKIARITWRGNGEMFAVNYWKDGGRRTFKVFQQNCKALYECVEVSLDCVIAWRPEGNMIANSMLLQDDAYGICIFEKNGYKRFDLPLVYNNCQVNDLKWSHRGEILAVLQENNLISLYTTSNYKWFLKQHLIFTQPLISFTWSTISDKFQLFTQNDFFTYEYQMVYDVYVDCVAVIDGKHLHLTRFRDSCLPPPLPQTTITSTRDAAINFVVLLPGDNLKFAIIDCDWFVSIYNKQTLLFSFKIQQSTDVQTLFYNFHWFNEVLNCIAVNRNNKIQLVSFMTNGKIIITKQPSNVADLKKVCNIQTVFELNTKLYQLENEVLFNNKHIILPNKSLLLKTVYCNTDYIFSLTTTNDFYVNDKCVLKTVTSFIVVSNKYLLLTTAANNLLYCIHIEKLQCDLQFFQRPIEQGAQLICSVENTPFIVLQIPRGNLEIISCRPIAIDILERHLSLNNWQEAVHFLRTDRLNFNLLVDLNIGRFLKNIDKFVEACKTPAVLNMFIQELEENNVLETTYLNCHHQTVITTNKRSLICEALLAHFQENDYATPLVTLALYHFDIEMAFTYIQDLYHRLPETQTALTNAIKTLITHTRNEADDFLFKKSLQLYDTNLTRHICTFTQMDPKFYSPFLNELDECNQVVRRFKINVYLKKFDLAVQYLIRDKNIDTDTLLKYIEAHRQVLPIVYGYYNRKSAMFKQISKLYGDYLSERKCYSEAATVYSRAELWLETLEQYKLANDWLAAITILDAKLTDIVKDRLGVIVEICADLISAKRYKEAATIQEQFLNNYEEAIKTLLYGYHFRDAIHLTIKHKRQDIICKLYCFLFFFSVLIVLMLQYMI